MPTEAQLRLTAFYQAVVDRALSGACNHWCQSDPGLPAPGNAVTLVPRFITPEHIALWPTLPVASGDFAEPACVLSPEAVRDAFTAILRLDSTVPESEISAMSRRVLHAVEQAGDASALSDGHVNAVVQVAVFGRVVFA